MAHGVVHTSATQEHHEHGNGIKNSNKNTGKNVNNSKNKKNSGGDDNTGKDDKGHNEVSFTQQVSPLSSAPNHQHIIIWRLDFDVDGVPNSVYEANPVRVEKSKTNPCGTAFGFTEELLAHETSRRFAVDRHWSVQSTKLNPVTNHPTAYSIELGRTNKLWPSSESPTAQRYSFLNCPIHFTKYHANELYGGEYPIF